MLIHGSGSVRNLSPARPRGETGSTRGEREQRGRARADRPQPIFTIGHSTRTVGELVDALGAHGVTVLVDIRTIRRSRTNPQFDEAVLGPALHEAGIRYEAFPALGGLRHGIRGQEQSPNAAWQNASFRHYADYAMTPPFREALDALMRIGAREPTAIMCAEAVWWRCHRRIVADHLLARGVPVVHLYDRTHAEPATPTPFAVIERGAVTYPVVSDAGPKR